MTIALITDGIYPYVMGGMQKHSYFLAKHFAQQGINVDLYHYTNDPSQYPLPFTDEELKFITSIKIAYPQSRHFPGHYLYERYLYSKKIYEILESRPLPDFIYAKGFAGWYLLKKRDKKLLEIPFGVNFHGYEMFQKWPDIKTGIKLQLLKWPVKYHIKNANFLFSYGGKISDIIKKLGGDSKIIEIPTGISSDWIRSIEEIKTNKKRKFIFVGRAERRKGIEEINNAIKKLSGRQDFEFHFIGPITSKMQLKTKNTYYHGSIRDQYRLRKILDDMDILVCPSYSEGMPNVIMEGMSRGLAIIATDVGAVNLMVNHQNGWLIKNNPKKNLLQCLKDAISIDTYSLEQMKHHSIQKVINNFTWEKVINKTISEIKKCLV